MPTARARHDVTPDFAEIFAEFCVPLNVDHLPEHVLDAVKTDLFDTLACATAGVSAAGVSKLAELVTGWGGTPEATIWCTGERVPAHHAAWVNGMMAHARDFDDTHDAAVLHAGVSVVPAAIAAAELRGQASGADLLAGITAGLELICRLGVSTTIGIIESGYMYTSLFGHFAATAAAARVLQFDREQTINALGIAFSQAAGTHQVTRDAAETKRVQPGFAAKSALISVAMTRAGIRGVRNTFEGVDGLFPSYLRGNYLPGRLREGLGERFDLLDLSFKPYPCCRFTHTAIDAALQIRGMIGADATVQRVVARVNRQAFEAVGTPIEMRRAPENVVQAQFSIPYTVGCALARGRVCLTDFTEAGIFNPAARHIASLVDVYVDHEIEREWSRNVSPTHLVVETDRGIFEARADFPRGNFGAPMTRADFDRKMQGCLDISGLNWRADTVERVHRAIDGLSQAENFNALLACLIASR